MQNLYIFMRYPAKIVACIKVMFSKPAGMAMLVPVLVMPEITTTVKALYLLLLLMVADFFTGVIASYIEFKKSVPVTPGSGKRYVIQSSLLILSGVKFIIYGSASLIAAGIEWVFIAQEFEPHKALKKLTLTAIVIGFFCVVEVYSIVMENFKRMGFDVLEVVKKMFKSGRDIYKTVKDDKTE